MISTPLACHIDRVVVTVGVKPRHGIGWNIHEALTIDTAAAFLVSTSDLAAKGLPLGLGLRLGLGSPCHEPVISCPFFWHPRSHGRVNECGVWMASFHGLV